MFSVFLHKQQSTKSYREMWRKCLILILYFLQDVILNYNDTDSIKVEKNILPGYIF